VRRLDVAIAESISLARAGRHADAALSYRRAVTGSSSPSAGWILPVEPMIDPASHRDVWSDTLVLIRQRAC
jgi:hypothetical protein